MPAELPQPQQCLLPAVNRDRVPKLPRDTEILPFEHAKAAAAGHAPPLPALPRQLYDHWLKRRREMGGPLLEHLWYEQPWKVRVGKTGGEGGWAGLNGMMVRGQQQAGGSGQLTCMGLMHDSCARHPCGVYTYASGLFRKVLPLRAIPVQSCPGSSIF